MARDAVFGDRLAVQHRAVALVHLEGIGRAGMAEPPQAFRAAFQLDVNEWNGRERLQLILRHLVPE